MQLPFVFLPRLSSLELFHFRYRKLNSFFLFFPLVCIYVFTLVAQNSCVSHVERQSKCWYMMLLQAITESISIDIKRGKKKRERESKWKKKWQIQIVFSEQTIVQFYWIEKFVCRSLKAANSISLFSLSFPALFLHFTGCHQVLNQRQECLK